MPYSTSTDNKETLLRSIGANDSEIKECLGYVTKPERKVIFMPQQEKATIVSRPTYNSYIKERRS